MRPFVVAAPLFAALLCTATLCAQAPAPVTPIALPPGSAPGRPIQEARAVWVTRMAYKSADDVKVIMENIARMHFNIVLFQVRGNGTVFYKSAIEPWAYELTSNSPDTTGKDPGWDPLKVACEEAHKRGLKIHAYMNVFPGWRGQKYAPPAAHQLWTEHPDWFMVDKKGNKMIPRDKRVDPKTETWYSFLNPAHPEVQKYLTSLYVEVARNYDIDGIHFDYVRYPGEIADFSYDPISLKRFADETGSTPDKSPKQWIDWRGKQVTAVVRSIYKEVTAIKPWLVIGGATIANAPRARDTYFARSQEWLKDGILDVAMPMNYHHGDIFLEQTKDFVAHRAGRDVYIGMAGSPDKSDSKSTSTQAALPMIAKEIDLVRQAGAQGVAVFSYDSLVTNHQPNEQAKRLYWYAFSEPAEIPVMPWKPKR